MKTKMPTPETALPGRGDEMPVPPAHHVLGTPLRGPFPSGTEQAVFGLGCFWGAEKQFWKMQGVFTTAVGYAGGFTKNPTYREVCSGRTGHNEVVLVVFDPKVVSYATLVKVFFESHDPTQGMRQGERCRDSVPVGYLHRFGRSARSRGDREDGLLPGARNGGEGRCQHRGPRRAALLLR